MVPNTTAHTVIPQTVVSPFQLSNSSGQALIQTQLALTQMFAPTQGVQPSVVLEMNATTNKDGVGEKYVFPPSYHVISFQCNLKRLVINPAIKRPFQK